MKIRAILIPLLFAGAAGMLPLQAAIDISGPVLGYYATPSGTVLYPIAGVAGAATVGAAITTDLEAIWVGPDSQSALGIKGGTIYLIRDIRNNTSRLPLTAWTGPVDAVAWAADSSGVIFYSAQRQVLQAATGLRDNPVVRGEIATAGLGGPLVSLHLSASPWNAAVVVRGGSGMARRVAARRPAYAAQSLYLLPALGPATLVGGVTRPGPVDFSSDAASLYVVDENTDRLLRVSGSRGETIQPVALQSPDLVPSAFTGLTVAPDGAHLLVLTGTARTACSVEIASGNTAFCSGLDFSPLGMKRLNGALYLLDGGAAPSAPLWILDSIQGQSFFVPLGGR